MTNTDSDLKDFQRRVFGEYETVKSLKKSANRIREDRANNKKGCLAIPMLIFAEFAINKAVKSENRKKNLVENEQEAGDLLRQSEISGKICELIGEINRREILTEENFVDLLTAALYRSDLANRFVIPENEVLYALMAFKIQDAGLENFCNDKEVS